MSSASDRAVAIVTMYDVTMNYACTQMSNINVPFPDKVTISAVLPERRHHPRGYPDYRLGAPDGADAAPRHARRLRRRSDL
ncbi:hypothetical protein ACWGLC_12735 [Dietzia sp. NPDC055877]